MNDYISSLGPYLKIIGMCYYANMQKKNRQKKLTLTTHKNYMKTHILHQTKQQLQKKSIETLIFELHGISGTSQR